MLFLVKNRFCNFMLMVTCESCESCERYEREQRKDGIRVYTMFPLVYISKPLPGLLPFSIRPVPVKFR